MSKGYDLEVLSGSSELWLRLAGFLDSKSENTKRTYLGIVKEWCSFLKVQPGTEEGKLALLSANDLHALAYRNWLKKRIGQRSRFESSATEVLPALENQKSVNDGTQSTLANATIAKKFAALRRIYRYLISSNLGIKENPFDSDKVSTPSFRSGMKRPTEMMDIEEVKKLFELPDLHTPSGVRDLAILSLLFGAGLRRSEIVKLKMADIKKSAKGNIYLRLRATKAKMDADQALPSWTSENLVKYLEIRTANGAMSGDPVFINYAKNKVSGLSDSGLYRIFKGYCLKINSSLHLTPHSARATAITRLLDKGFSHREVKEFSRHSSVQMVEVYDKRRITVDENPGLKLDYD